MSEEKNKGGRPPFVATDKEREDVQLMAKYGVPHEQIASTVRGGIDADTLKKYFKQELIEGKSIASKAIGQSLFQKATGGDTAAQIWWTKSQMNWRGESLDLSTKDGSMTPQVIERVIVKDKGDE